jgi:hypothetical protein
MLNRIRWILEAYSRHPLVRAFFALAVVGFAANVAVFGRPASRYRTPNYPSFPRANLYINSRATLEAIRRAGRQSEVDGIDLGTVWIETAPKKTHWDESLKKSVTSIAAEPDEAFYQILDEFPNLRQVWGVYAYPCDMRHFTKLSKLEYLVAHGSEVRHLEALKSLSNLKRLDLNVAFPPAGLGALIDLPNLEMLVFTSRAAVGDDLLKTVARFPHLKTLVLQFSIIPIPPDWPKDRKFNDRMPPITTAGLDALAAAPKLDAIYFGGFVSRSDEEDLLKLLRKSRAAVYPAVVEKERILQYCLAILPTILFSIPIGAQLTSQFQSPFRRIAPRFASSHAYVGIGLSAAVVAMSAFSFIGHGIPWLVAILFSISIVGTAIATSGRNEIRVLPSSRGALGGLGGLWLAFLVCLSSDRWALTEASATIVSLVSLLAAFAVASAWMILNQLVWTQPVSSIVGWKSDRSAAVVKYKGWAWASKNAEARIEHLPSGLHAEGLWRRIERLRAGNAPFQTTLFAIVMFACIALVPRISYGVLMGDRIPMDFSAIWLNSIVVLMATTFQVCNIWRTRLAILPIEIMRPWSRTKLQNSMALAFTVDLLSPVAIVAIAQAGTVNLNPDYSLQWRSLPFDILIWFITDLTIAVGIGALGLAIHRLWLAAAIAVIVAYGCVFGTMFLAMFSIGLATFRADKLTARAVESQLWLPILVGLVLSCLMYRRWMRIEIGRRA